MQPLSIQPIKLLNYPSRTIQPLESTQGRLIWKRSCHRCAFSIKPPFDSSLSPSHFLPSSITRFLHSLLIKRSLNFFHLTLTCFDSLLSPSHFLPSSITRFLHVLSPSITSFYYSFNYQLHRSTFQTHHHDKSISSPPWHLHPDVQILIHSTICCTFGQFRFKSP